jgi:Tetracycline resistance leader peptide
MATRASPELRGQSGCLCFLCHQVKGKDEFRNDANERASYRWFCNECNRVQLGRWRAIHGTAGNER